MQLQREFEMINEKQLDLDTIFEKWKSFSSKIKAFAELEGVGQKKLRELLQKQSI